MNQLPPAGSANPPAPLSAELLRTFKTASAKHRRSFLALRNAVCEYLDSLKAAGTPREDAIVAARAFVAEVHSREAGHEHATDADDRFMAEVAEWCIAHWDIPKG